MIAKIFRFLFKIILNNMCYNYSLLNKTKNGVLLWLKGCKNYQLTYKNLNFNLTEEELLAFENYLKKEKLDFENFENFQNIDVEGNTFTPVKNASDYFQILSINTKTIASSNNTKLL